MAASTPYRRTGWRVISTTSSGFMQDSSMPTPSRTLRYSGSDRPACRMNQTGVCGTGSPRAALRKALSERSAEVAHTVKPRRSAGVFAHRDAGPDLL